MGKWILFGFLNSCLWVCAQLGDVNGDGFVNVHDLRIVVEKWRTDPAGQPELDVNSDGSVDILDAILIMEWGGTSCIFDCSPVASEIHFRGDELFLQGFDGHGFGPGTLLHVDLNADGDFEETVKVDGESMFTVALDGTSVSPSGTASVYSSSADMLQTSEVYLVDIIQDAPSDPSNSLPVSLFPNSDLINVCGCVTCEESSLAVALDLWSAFAGSNSPEVFGVELATGLARHSFPIQSFATRAMGFDFGLQMASAMDYDGPFGVNFSHSYNMMIVQTGALTGHVVTPDLRTFAITSLDGVNWELPEGFYSTLLLDAPCRRWKLVHFSGLEVTFFQATLGHPGYPVTLRDPNGNLTRLDYNGAGLLSKIVTDLGQGQIFHGDATGRIDSFVNHIGVEWSFVFDGSGRLTHLVSPTTEFADIEAGVLLNDTNLAGVLVNQSRTTQFFYDDPTYSNSVTAFMDERFSVPRVWIYDGLGRVSDLEVNGWLLNFQYDPTDRVVLPVLDPGNFVTRVTDRSGNVTDYEMHGVAGGPLGPGQFGLRRRVDWTETGLENPPLRVGEPNYFEQRYLYECNCLAPVQWTSAFSDTDATGLVFDPQGMPTNWPSRVYQYNDRSQVTRLEVTDGSDSIVTEYTYDDFDHFSRLLIYRPPRTFDDHPLYSGRNFEHTFTYDGAGNPIRHDGPDVTLGATQTIFETWQYNSFGQVTQHTDATGNVTLFDYFVGDSTGGNMNTPGSFGGYLRRIEEGAPGSTDPVTSLVTEFKVNALGVMTQATDPHGNIYEFSFNELGELTQILEPSVILGGGGQAQYEIAHVYDGVGNVVMTRRSNIDDAGTVAPNAFIDVSLAYDTVGNVLAMGREVDDNDGHDLVTRYEYDGNENLIIVEYPEGNRVFHIYDERDLLFKTFEGVDPGAFIFQGYPNDKRDNDLGTTPFVGLKTFDYDSRRNCTHRVDGRGSDANTFYDFASRPIAFSDGNEIGWTYSFDDGSNIITSRRGLVDRVTGNLTQHLRTIYNRYDELGRLYQEVRDLDPMSDESTDLDPSLAGSPDTVYQFDENSRIVGLQDANGNLATLGYDAASRVIVETDALGNETRYLYDGNDNLIRREEDHIAGPGAVGPLETYVWEFEYDARNRLVLERDRGLDGMSFDHVKRFDCDSRGNVALVWDAEGRTTRWVFDDLDRPTRISKFDGDPGDPGTVEVSRNEFLHDGNDRVVEARTFADITQLGAPQTTRYAYDSLDRLVRTIYPDSDDPIDGSGNGGDGIFDRWERLYDENSNLVQITDPRGVVFANIYDFGDRLIRQEINLSGTTAAPGSVTVQQFVYDAMNRMTHAGNNFALVTLTYDPLSRIVSETQSIALDGSGAITVGPENQYLSDNYQFPINVTRQYDANANETLFQVFDDVVVELRITRAFDALNRVGQIDAEYFGLPGHLVGTYTHFGPRLQKLTTGNGAYLDLGYDPKQRISSHSWHDALDEILVAFDYEYDAIDKVQYEAFGHDVDGVPLRDWFAYDPQNELVGADYRSTSLAPPILSESSFEMDDVYNRITSSVTEPFYQAGVPETRKILDVNTLNDANELAQIVRNGTFFYPTYDRAGNMTSLPVLPVTGDPEQDFVVADMLYDAFSLPFRVETGVNSTQDYRYDALSRRVAALQIAGSNINSSSRRFIYDGPQVVTERLFDSGATLSLAPSTLERIVVLGNALDQPLLTAIDRDGDGMLGGGNLKNVRDISADQEYYFLDNRLGSILAILDADDPSRIMEYYRYSAFGDATILPVVDGNGDELEDTPFDLSDNYAQGYERSSEEFGNPFLFTARRYDDLTGLYHYRSRAYDAYLGRFISRDPLEYADLHNLYVYATNDPVNAKDPMGLITVETQIIPKWKKRSGPWKQKIGDEARGKTSGETRIIAGDKKYAHKHVKKFLEKKQVKFGVFITDIQCELTEEGCEKPCKLGKDKSISLVVRPFIQYVKGKEKGTEAINAIHEAVHARQIADLVESKVAKISVRSECQSGNGGLRLCILEVDKLAAQAIIEALEEWQSQNASHARLEAGKNKKGSARNADYKENEIEREAREESEAGRWPDNVQKPKEFRPRRGGRR